jgi:lysophospholipase L1-like esterase
MQDFKIKFSDGLKFILVFCISILFFEIYFRATEIILPSYVYDDPELGRTHKANALVNLVGAEGFYMGQINEYGYPGKGYSQEKEPGTLRIALIGDSYVEGFQLFERHHFARLLENDLPKKIKRKVEVLNFGTGGADFRGMYLRYSKLAKKFNPDLSLFFIKREDLLNKDKIPMPEPVLTSDSLTYTHNFLNDESAKIRSKFAFVRDYSTGNLIKEVFEVIYTGRLLPVLFEQIYLELNPTNENIKSTSVAKDEFYNLNKRIIELIEKENKSERKVFLVEVEELPEKYHILFKEYNVPIVKLYEELNKYPKYETNYWKASDKYGHWNQKAHSIINDFLVKRISNDYEKIKY